MCLVGACGYCIVLFIVCCVWCVVVDGLLSCSVGVQYLQQKVGISRGLWYLEVKHPAGERKSWTMSGNIVVVVVIGRDTSREKKKLETFRNDFSLNRLQNRQE